MGVDGLCTLEKDSVGFTIIKGMNHLPVIQTKVTITTNKDWFCADYKGK